MLLTFECNGPTKTWTLTAAKVAEYQQSFPGVDVAADSVRRSLVRCSWAC